MSRVFLALAVVFATACAHVPRTEPTITKEATPKADIAERGVETAMPMALPPEPAPAPVEPAPAPDAPAQVIALSDDEILKVAQIANQTGIEVAKLAEQRAKSPDVRRFARSVSLARASQQRKTMRIASVLNLQPASSPAADDLKVDSDKQRETLTQKSGVEFDRAFLDAQIVQQQNVLKLIDDRLLPEAKEPTVKALVRDLRPEVERELAETRSLADKVGK